MSRPVPITMLYLTFISNGSWTLFTWRGHSNGDAVRMSLANLSAQLQSTCSAPSSPQKARRAGSMIVFVCYDDTQNPESTTLPSPCTPPVHMYNRPLTSAASNLVQKAKKNSPLRALTVVSLKKQLEQIKNGKKTSVRHIEQKKKTKVNDKANINARDAPKSDR
jgi:hypothetical protein